MASIREKYAEKFVQLRMSGFKGGDPNDFTKPLDPPIPLTPAELNEIEQLIGARLPHDYRQFLLEIGGALFLDAWIRPIEPQPHDPTPLDLINIYGGEVDGNLSVKWSISNYADRVPKPLLAFGESDSGDQFCIGLQRDEVGKIYFWDHENERNEEDYRRQFGHGKKAPRAWLFENVTLVANSFDEFLSKLETGLGGY